MTSLLEALGLLGFEASPQASNTFVKHLSGGHEVKVRYNDAAPKKSTIEYPQGVVIHHRSTSTFAQPESLIVLQCVCSLIAKGYEPRLIELEKTWTLGHDGKGRLDVLLRDPSGEPYALIECKNWGAAYTRERNRTLQDGGQLFSYFVQERAARGLYLYCCRIDEVPVVLTELIRTEPLVGNSHDELLASWNRSFEPQGIFHPESGLYEDEYRGLRFCDLRALDHESGAGVFHSFAEILRRNVISDKSNAFNKIFNLFLCKIADEDAKASRPQEELEFQWKNHEDPSEFLTRLQGLYESGLRDYLCLDVEQQYSGLAGDFAFVDVYNSATFDRNVRVLREVVELLQQYKIRYSARQQHLGDFFEMLLATGLKQEAGQFFTPVPLVRAILKSLPMSDLVSRRVDTKSRVIAPLMIDYACGSGHFLTEAIEEIDQELRSLDVSQLTKRQATWMAKLEGFEWAEDSIYGVELDYRLAKVSKVATFLNGDGQARIAQADGLGDFDSEPGYVGELRSNTATQQLHRFDLVASNPPFAVASFRSNLERTAHRFRLYEHLTAESGEIECLFLERAAQLLRDGGVAGILFPLSILQNGRTIYAAARRLLAMDFEIVGMLELREKTFLATSTTTVCLFLRKRSSADVEDAVERLRSLGAAEGHDDRESLQAAGIDVDALLGRMTELQDLREAGYEEDLIAHSVRALADRGAVSVLAFSGESGKEQERFLGYRFSRQRGSEGIQLVDPDDMDRCGLLFGFHDSVADQIRAAFSGVLQPVPANLTGHVAVVNASDVWRSSDWCLCNPSSQFQQVRAATTNSPYGDFIDAEQGRLLPLGELVDQGLVTIIRGANYPKNSEVPEETTIRILTASNVDLESRRLLDHQFRYLRSPKGTDSDMQPKVGDVVIVGSSGSLKTLGKIAVAEKDWDGAYIGGFLMILRSASRSIGKVLEYNLLSARFRRYVSGLKEQNISNLGVAKLRAFPVMLPENLDAFLDIVDGHESQGR